MANALLAAHFQAAVNAAPWYDQGLRGVTSVVGRIAAAVRDWARTKADTPEERAAIKGYALEFFDGLDLPYVEGVSEAALKSLLRSMLGALLDEVLLHVGS